MIREIKKKLKMKRLAAAIFLMQLLYSFSAYADVTSDLKNSKLFKGTVDVLKGISNALLAITVLITIALAIVKGIQWQTAEEQEKPQKRKALIDTIMIGIVVASIAGIITVILKAYGLTDSTGANIGAMMHCWRFI